MPDVDFKRMLASLSEDYVPSLNTLRGGLLALVRQWKAILVRPGRPEASRKKLVNPTGSGYNLIHDGVDSAEVLPVSPSFVSSSSFSEPNDSNRAGTNFEGNDIGEAKSEQAKFADFVSFAMAKQRTEKARNRISESNYSASFQQGSEDIKSSNDELNIRYSRSKSLQLRRLSSAISAESGNHQLAEADKSSIDETDIDIEASRDDQTFKGYSEKVSFPTTRIRLTEATIVFHPLLRSMAIDTGDCRDEPYRSTLSLSGELGLLDIYVVNSNTILDTNTSSSHDSDTVTEANDNSNPVSAVFVCQQFHLDLFMHQDPVVASSEQFHGMNKYKFRPTNATTKSSVELKNRWLIKLETKRISHDLNLSLLRLIHHLTSMIEPLKQHRNEIWDDIVNNSPVLPGEKHKNRRASAISTNVENLRRIATNRVWLTMYKLLDCYSAMGVTEATADAKVAAKLGAGPLREPLRTASFSTRMASPDLSNVRRRGTRLRVFSESGDDIQDRRKTTAVQYLRQLHTAGVERVDPMSVVCVIKVQEITVTANVGRLHLKGTIASSHFSVTYRLKQPIYRGVVKKLKSKKGKSF